MSTVGTTARIRRGSVPFHSTEAPELWVELTDHPFEVEDELVDEEGTLLKVGGWWWESEDIDFDETP